jgi:AbrB family looped-hinge helix DNA binding protein
MGLVATVTSNGMVSIPAKIRAKYSITEGSKVEFVDADDGIRMITLKSLRELRGAFKDHHKGMKQAIRELENEHRREARSEAIPLRSMKTGKTCHQKRNKSVREVIKAQPTEVMVGDEDVTTLAVSLLKRKESGVEPVRLRLRKKAVDLVAEGRGR